MAKALEVAEEEGAGGLNGNAHSSAAFVVRWEKVFYVPQPLRQLPQEEARRTFP
ncbi:hypothetical protein [Deinococcus aetherius]|uniref:hypothetical protein n=1 Tax=Deinococcus aetherius TaxID=200252 RepID=UPI002231C2A0|nr:hypothetical protein [Deinococcus aetherius]